MKHLSWLLMVTLIGCSDKDANPYPVASRCGECSLDDFKLRAYNYYHLEDYGPFKICILDPGFCNDFYALENFIKDNLK